MTHFFILLAAGRSFMEARGGIRLQVLVAWCNMHDQRCTTA